MEKIYLVDGNKRLVDFWSIFFKGYSEIECFNTNYFNISADAIVSPANCLGFMDGGIDKEISKRIPNIQEKVQGAILEKHHGELPVGCAEIVETENEFWPYLICAPTMRTPESVEKTVNAYFAFRAILLATKRHNESSHKKIKSILCCGLGTGVGKMEPYLCAMQMYKAYNQISGDGKPPTGSRIYDFLREHNKMKVL